MMKMMIFFPGKKEEATHPPTHPRTYQALPPSPTTSLLPLPQCSARATKLPPSFARHGAATTYFVNLSTMFFLSSSLLPLCVRESPPVGFSRRGSPPLVDPEPTTAHDPSSLR